MAVGTVLVGDFQQLAEALIFRDQLAQELLLLVELFLVHLRGALHDSGHFLDLLRLLPDDLVLALRELLMLAERLHKVDLRVENLTLRVLPILGHDMFQGVLVVLEGRL